MRHLKLDEMDFFQLLDVKCWAEDMKKKGTAASGRDNVYYDPLIQEVEKAMYNIRVKGALEQFWNCKEIFYEGEEE